MERPPLQTLSRNEPWARTYSGEYPAADETAPFDGLVVTESEYWETYYEHPGEYIYEYKNGRLEAKPVADLKGSETHQWFTEVLRC